MKIKRFTELNEKAEMYDFGFTSEVNRRDVSYYGEDTVVDKSLQQYVDAGNLTIEWEMDFDNRKSGINSMAPVIHKIRGYYTVITPSDDEDGEKEIEISISKDDSEWEMIGVLTRDFEFGSSMYPSDIEVDFKKKKITVNF